MDDRTKVSSFVENLESNGCEVHLYYAYNPHIIFVKKKINNVMHFCQIGIRSIYPVNYSRSCTDDGCTDNWNSDVTKTLQSVLHGSKKLYFVNCLSDDFHSLFDGVLNNFGDLFVLSRCNKLSNVAKILCQRKDVFLCPEKFVDFYHRKCAILKPPRESIDFLKSQLSFQIEEQKKLIPKSGLIKCEESEDYDNYITSIHCSSSMSCNADESEGKKYPSERKYVKSRSNMRKQHSNSAKSPEHNIEFGVKKRNIDHSQSQNVRDKSISKSSKLVLKKQVDDSQFLSLQDSNMNEKTFIKSSKPNVYAMPSHDIQISQNQESCSNNKAYCRSSNLLKLAIDLDVSETNTSYDSYMNENTYLKSPKPNARTVSSHDIQISQNQESRSDNNADCRSSNLLKLAIDLDVSETNTSYDSYMNENTFLKSPKPNARTVSSHDIQISQNQESRPDNNADCRSSNLLKLAIDLEVNETKTSYDSYMNENTFLKSSKPAHPVSHIKTSNTSQRSQLQDSHLKNYPCSSSSELFQLDKKVNDSQTLSIQDSNSKLKSIKPSQLNPEMKISSRNLRTLLPQNENAISKSTQQLKKQTLQTTTPKTVDSEILREMRALSPISFEEISHISRSGSEFDGSNISSCDENSLPRNTTESIEILNFNKSDCSDSNQNIALESEIKYEDEKEKIISLSNNETFNESDYKYIEDASAEDPELTLSDEETQCDTSLFYLCKKPLANPNFSKSLHNNSFLEYNNIKKESLNIGVGDCLLDAFNIINANDNSDLKLISNTDVNERKEKPFESPFNTTDEKTISHLSDANDIYNALDDEYEKLSMLKTTYSDEISMDFLENMCTPKIFMSCKFGKPPSFRDDFGTIFSKPILKSMNEMKIDSPLSSQKIVWPSVMRGVDTLLIGPRNSGKTIGFLVPLCSILTEIKFSDLPDTNGPVLWIVCPSLTVATHVERVCLSLLRYYKDITVLRVDNASDKSVKDNSLLEGCTILISTPVLIEYEKYTDNILCMKRLSYLMFCNADVLSDIFYSEIEQIYNVCKNISKNRQNEDLNLQIVAHSTEYCRFMSFLAYELYNPLVAINAFQEALVCSEASKQAVFVQSNKKMIELKNLLKNLSEDLRKIVIVCNSDETISNIDENIDGNRYRVIKVFNHLSLQKHTEIENEWKSSSNLSKPTVLISCDNGLFNLNITDANCLIHYEIPSIYTAFRNRFSTIIHNLTPTWIKKDNIPPSVILYIDESNRNQLPKLINFLKRCGVEIDNKIDSLAESLINLQDIRKADFSISLCNELLSYGRCRNIWNCPERHSILTEYDKMQNGLPQSGCICFKIIHIHNVSHYSARLISFYESDGTRVNVNQNYLNLALKMYLYFTQNEKMPVVNLTPGKLCIAEMKDNQFSRCKIVKVLTKETVKMKSNVLVNLIDKNSIEICNASKIFQIPDEFCEESNTAIQVRLVGVSPNHKDVAWSTINTDKIKKLYTEFGNNMFLRGNIVLGINNTYWLDSVQCCQYLKTVNKIVVRANVTNYIINNGIGILNPDHLPLLYKICAKNSFDLPNYHLCVKSKTNLDEKKVILPKPQWAFLEMDKFSEIYFSSGLNPNTFFVRIVKWDSCLTLLSKDIKKYVDDIQKRNIPNHSTYNVNDFCLAKFSDDEYYRCRITSIETVEDAPIKYNCFFVDYGDTGCVNEEGLLPLSSKLITQLPFQAIECKLVGIKPDLEEWSKSAIEFLQNFCFESQDDDLLKILCAKVMYTEAAEFTNGNKSALYMFDPLSGEESFNDMFISKGFAKILSADAHYLNDAAEEMEKHLENISVEKENKDIFDAEDDFNIRSSSDSQNCFEFLEFDEQNYSFDNGSENDSDESINGFDCQFTMKDYQLLMSENKAKIIEIPQDTKSSELHNYFDTKENNSEMSKVLDTNVCFNNVNNVENVHSQIKCIEKPKHNIPAVRWSQNEERVLIKIDLIGVDTYNLVIENDSIVFDCLLRGTQYKLDMKLFGCVDKEASSHALHGMYICVKLVKYLKTIWPSLLITKLKMHWLKRECETGYSDSEEEIIDEIKNISEDESSDEDEEEIGEDMLENHDSYDFP